MMDNYAKEVEDFRFIPLRETTRARRNQDDQPGRLRLTIGVNGWLTDKNDITQPWSGLSNDSEVFALRYEMDKLLSLGKALENMVGSYAWKTVKSEILRRTVLATIGAALWPAYILSLATTIDNPFNLALNRSEKAGLVLADALINKVQGERPVTLVGYSLGARAIYTCLRTLAERRAFGLIDTVVLIGAPAPSDPARWQKLRSVVAGTIFNVYTSNDYILGFLYRTHSLQFGVAGLQPIQGVKGVRNLDLSEEVSGHLRYPDLISQILTRCGFPNVAGGDRPIEREEDLNAAAAQASGQDADGWGDWNDGPLIDFGEEPEPKSLVSQTEPKSRASQSPGSMVAPVGSSSATVVSAGVSSSRNKQAGSGRGVGPTRSLGSSSAVPAEDRGIDPLSGTFPIRTVELPLRGVRPQVEETWPEPPSPPLRVIEPKSLVEPSPSTLAGATGSSRPEPTQNPLSHSYVGTLDMYDGVSDEEVGGIRMVSYDSD